MFMTKCNVQFRAQGRLRLQIVITVKTVVIIQIVFFPYHTKLEKIMTCSVLDKIPREPLHAQIY